jgi:uncharacterized membrane protein
MMYLLAGTFSPHIALPSMISLALMPYHIYISQDGRAYALELLLGMIGFYGLIRHLKTSQWRYLAFAAFFYSALLYLSYSSVLFIVLSQAFWLYRPDPGNRTPRFLSIFILNGLILLVCLPWLLFLATHISGHPLLQRMDTQSLGSYGSILYGMFSDWCLNSPILVLSILSLLHSLQDQPFCQFKVFHQFSPTFSDFPFSFRKRDCRCAQETDSILLLDPSFRSSLRGFQLMFPAKVLLVGEAGF